MGSGKGQQKRVNLKIKDIKTLARSTMDYNKMKNGFLNDEHVIQIRLDRQKEFNKHMDKIYAYMKHRDLRYIEYDKNDYIHVGLIKKEVDWIEAEEQKFMLGVCRTYNLPNVNGKSLRVGKIVIIEERIKHELELQAKYICNSINKEYDDNWDNEFLDSNRTLNELFNIFKQRIILHEIGHALMPPIVPEGGTQNKSYEEFKAELFAKKILDNFYGEKDFHKVVSFNYVQRYFKKRIKETNKEQALKELAKATAFAHVAANEFFSFLDDGSKNKKN